jgi:cytochrome c-type biogenesis protein CcmH
MKKYLILLMLLAAVPYCIGPIRARGAPFFPIIGSAVAAPAADTFSDPAMEDRARSLQRQLRCLVCQGESIDESGSDFAADVRRLVHQQIAEGRSDGQIRDFLTVRYGNFILMKPPLEADTYFLWAAPFLVLILAGAVAIFVIGKARRAAADAPPPEL